MARKSAYSRSGTTVIVDESSMLTEEQLASLAYHDALTGLPNRILVEQEIDLALVLLDQLLARCTRD